MSNYSIGEIYSVEVAYQERDGRKKERPVVIVDIEKSFLIVAPMTGISPKDPPKHYDLYKIPVCDWKQAGLKKMSYVKSHKSNILRITPDALKKYRGALSKTDLHELLKAIFS